MLKVITRKEAREQGFTRFFTGRPCEKGHLVERITSNGKCSKCHRLSTTDQGRRRRERNKTDYAVRKAKAITYKGGKCMDCGWSGHHAGYEFDHPDGRPVRYMGLSYVLSNKPWPAVLRWLDTVDMVCGTCHNIRTWRRQQDV